MVKLVALYKQPEDKKAFDEHYFNTHLPLANKMPGLKKVEITRFTETPMGTEAPFYLKAEMFFDDKETLMRAMGSLEGKAAAKDVMSFAGKLVTMMIGEELDGNEK
jgi:uncharacterized protein (TIGR02118 family)